MQRAMRQKRMFVAAGAGSLLAGILCLQGCGPKNVHASAPAPTPVAEEATRPMTVAPDTDANPPGEALSAPPTLPPATASNPPAVNIPSAKPEAPRKPAEEQPAADASAGPSAHTPAPQISPQLSANDQASYERKINDDVTLAEKNLQEANGKQLSAGQHDLVEKIRSFLTQSREASKSGDWTRAQNLAQKARLLSIEFVNSL
jgi:hypothetical protein